MIASWIGRRCAFGAGVEGIGVAVDVGTLPARRRGGGVGDGPLGVLRHAVHVPQPGADGPLVQRVRTGLAHQRHPLVQRTTGALVHRRGDGRHHVCRFHAPIMYAAWSPARGRLGPR